jgi:hypothetical protein
MPAAAFSVELPDEPAEWAHKNPEWIMHVQGALKDLHLSELTEQDIWEEIARASRDPDFMKAHKEKLAAEKTWNKLNHPLNAPLGRIGEALLPEETVRAREDYHATLANFTIISEGLLQRRPDLAKLLNVLLVQKRMLDHSLKRAREVMRAAKELTEVFSLREAFDDVARPKLSRHFRSSMRRLLMTKKQFNAQGAPFPWLLKPEL